MATGFRTSSSAPIGTTTVRITKGVPTPTTVRREDLASTPAWTAESNSNNAFFGWVVATAGDLNADGFSDVIIGAPQYSNGAAFEGAVFVYLGSVSGLATTTSPPWTVEGGNDSELVGLSAGTAGDFNGDGFSDLVIGFVQNNGIAYVLRGSLSGLFYFENLEAPNTINFGESVGTAGDVNGDGFSDVIVSADIDGGVRGAAYVFHGNSTGGSPFDPDWSAPMNECCGLVATAGDVNGDGFSDVIVGDPYGSGNRAFVHLGNSGDGLDRIAFQARTDGSAPIWPLGNSDSDTSLRLKALGRTPAGRGNVRMQFEVKPAGVPFDGTGLVPGSIANTGAPGASGSAVPLSQLASGLTPATLYHWRLRVLSDSPFFPRSPWMWLPYNGATEADVRTGQATAAVGEEPHPTASALWLAPGAPNPFNPRTTLSFLVPARTPVRLAIHDVQGRLVRVLVDEVLPAGQHAVEWDGRDGRGQELATGVYLSRLEAGGEVRSRKLALVK